MATRIKKPKTSYYQICSRCGEELPLAMYYKDGSTKTGTRYRKECKACYKKRRDDKALEKTLPQVIATTPVVKLD